jgi:hypothetical protein
MQGSTSVAPSSEIGTQIFYQLTWGVWPNVDACTTGRLGANVNQLRGASQVFAAALYVRGTNLNASKYLPDTTACGFNLVSTVPVGQGCTEVRPRCSDGLLPPDSWNNVRNNSA